MSSFRIYNQSLCPDLWDEFKHLDGRIRVNLLKMAYDFYEKTKFVAPIVDVWLMGSIANYNWTPESDVDVHIIIDFSKLQMPPETASKVAKAAGAEWNKEHEVTIKGHKVEINIQSVKAEKPYVMGIYSLAKDVWVREPQHLNVKIDKALVQAKFSGMKKYVESAISSGNRDEMKKAKDYVDAFRQYGLDTGGELSIENIVYKILRSKGLIKGLKEAIVSTYDQQMTVKETNNVAYSENARFGIGAIGSSDEVLFKEIPRDIFSTQAHGKGGNPMGRRRFRYMDGTVEWSDCAKPDQEQINLVNSYLERRGFPVKGHTSIYDDFGPSDDVEEVKMGDINSVHPHDPRFYDKGQGWKIEGLTLSNLMALRDKESRFYAAAKRREDVEGMRHSIEGYAELDAEIKSRLAQINAPVTEELDKNYYAATDFQQRKDMQMCEIAHFLKSHPVNVKVPWKTISASLLKRTWLQFGKYNRVNANNIDKIADQILTNIARLDAANDFQGHSSYDPREEIVDSCDIEFSDEEWNNNAWRFENKDGLEFVSDYGIDPLRKMYSVIFSADTPEEKLYACDRALNIVHRRNDLASMFVEGGTSTLNMVADQGGFDAKYSPGQVNRELRADIDEGVGWGSTKNIAKDPLHIPGERWRIKWDTTRKTPKMPTEEEVINELVEQILMESPEIKTLKKHRVTLTDEERKTVMDADAVWHLGKDGNASPAVWKSIINGKTWYVTNTHRLYQCKASLKGAITAYHKVVKQTA